METDSISNRSVLNITKRFQALHNKIQQKGLQSGCTECNRKFSDRLEYEQ